MSKFHISNHTTEIKDKDIVFWTYYDGEFRELTEILEVVTDAPNWLYEVGEEKGKLTVKSSPLGNGVYIFRLRCKNDEELEEWVQLRVFYAPPSDKPIVFDGKAVFDAMVKQYPQKIYNFVYVKDSDPERQEKKAKNIKSVAVTSLSEMFSDVYSTFDEIKNKFFFTGLNGWINQPVPFLNMNRHTEAKPYIRGYGKDLNTFAIATNVASMVLGATGRIMKVGVSANVSRVYDAQRQVPVELTPNGTVRVPYSLAKLFNGAVCGEFSGASGIPFGAILDNYAVLDHYIDEENFVTCVLDGFVSFDPFISNIQPLFILPEGNEEPTLAILDYLSILDNPRVAGVFTEQAGTAIADTLAVAGNLAVATGFADISGGELECYIKTVSLGREFCDLTYRTVMVLIDDLGTPIDEATKLTLVKSIYSVVRASVEVAIVFASQYAFRFSVDGTYPNTSEELPIVGGCKCIVQAEKDYQITPFTYFTGLVEEI